MAKQTSLAKRRVARKTQERVQKKAKLGTGKRFAALKKSVKAGGARDPGAVAAAIGRKKYGKKKFAKLSAKGRKRRK